LIGKQDASYTDSPHWVAHKGEEENSNINDLDHQHMQ